MFSMPSSASGQLCPGVAPSRVPARPVNESFERTEERGGRPIAYLSIDLRFDKALQLADLLVELGPVSQQRFMYLVLMSYVVYGPSAFYLSFCELLAKLF